MGDGLNTGKITNQPTIIRYLGSDVHEQIRS